MKTKSFPLNMYFAPQTLKPGYGHVLDSSGLPRAVRAAQSTLVLVPNKGHNQK